MENYLQKELDAALQLICTTINNCEKMQLKFAEGTSQHSLLKNRIKALYISKALIEKEAKLRRPKLNMTKNQFSTGDSPLS